MAATRAARVFVITVSLSGLLTSLTTASCLASSRAATVLAATALTSAVVILLAVTLTRAIVPLDCTELALFLEARYLPP